jgi:hypothetical protein
VTNWLGGNELALQVEKESAYRVQPAEDGRVSPLVANIGNVPDATRAIVSDEHAAILRDSDAYGKFDIAFCLKTPS